MKKNPGRKERRNFSRLVRVDDAKRRIALNEKKQRIAAGLCAPSK